LTLLALENVVDIAMWLFAVADAVVAGALGAVLAVVAEVCCCWNGANTRIVRCRIKMDATIMLTMTGCSLLPSFLQLHCSVRVNAYSIHIRLIKLSFLIRSCIDHPVVK
jgi:hypothetical protein